MGQRITWTIAASCGGCFFCDDELPQKCEKLFKYGHEKITEAHPLSGGLAEYCLLAPGTGIVCLPAELSDEIACPANCATATIAAALRYAGPLKNRVVLLQGAGMLGLTACAMAREAGAKQVLCSDINDQRLALALRFGADVAVRADSPDLAKALHASTAGRGADIIIELSGVAQAIESGLPLLRTGGKYVWVGTVAPTRPVEILPEQVVRKYWSLVGVHNYAPRDLVTAIEFLGRCHAKYPFSELVGRRYPLNEVDAAFALALSNAGARIAALLANGYLWNSNGLAEYFFRLYCRDDFLERYDIVRKQYILETQLFYRQLAKVAGVVVYPSMANFALVEILGGVTADEVMQHLLVRHGVYVRTCSDKIGLDGQFLRIASRGLRENQMIIDALSDVLGSKDS